MATGHHNVHPLPQTDRPRATHTVIRDRAASRAASVSSSRRVVRLLLASAPDPLPFDKQEVVTPIGETFDRVKSTPNPCAVPVIRCVVR
ncbi:uracil phosphoribosyltransferase [Streptomyces sp. A1136]|uniref:uracil phosphoribosyltransferase n=1 Tax=Streptomyces sp. A1136 TaxID=2563102 RepID=UPI00109E3E44|nr:uracil phosphoribosyltransferase [Streptomyces sp. A1136]THA54656.1 hypothetical protein E6R62_15905 [Streptomyces sp. A1136]